MSKTIFITGATSGFGLATARLFTEQGWRVDDRLCERIFVFSPDRTLALRAARLAGQPARPALRHPMLLLCMVCCDPPSLRA